MRKLIALLAVIFWSLTPAAHAAELPQIGGVVNAVEAKATVLVNGVPAITFGVEKDGSGGRGFVITDWLTNGTNTISLVVEPVADRAKAELDIQNVATAESLLKLNQEGKGQVDGAIEVEGVPEWAFAGAEPQAEDAPGLSDAVAALYIAYEKKNIDEIVKISSPFFADQTLIGGLTSEIFTQQLKPLLSVGQLQPLAEVEVRRYLDGRLFHVRNGEGNAPINIEFTRSGTKGAMRTGEWWSKIDGVWRVVR